MVELIPKLSELPAHPKRVVLHWTGGGPKANAVDKQHYHFIVNQDGTIVQGVHSVKDNMRAVSGTDYAAHTGGFNSFSVGVSFAGMLNCTPKDLGPYPLTESQIAAGLKFVAQCCKAWGLPPDAAHVFTHHEAWTIHRVPGTQNKNKWDICVLKFKPELEWDEVGPWIREQVAAYLKAL